MEIDEWTCVILYQFYDESNFITEQQLNHKFDENKLMKICMFKKYLEGSGIKNWWQWYAELQKRWTVSLFYGSVKVYWNAEFFWIFKMYRSQPFTSLWNKFLTNAIRVWKREKKSYKSDSRNVPQNIFTNYFWKPDFFDKANLYFAVCLTFSLLTLLRHTWKS